MSEFIVSARKYRPATFESVVGQQSITSTLKNAIERGQLAHAYLFCGPRGVGKTTCARIFAKTINCLSPNGSEACNECESCRAFNEGRSLNIHELDAASNNSVDDIRTLIEQVRILPQVGRYSLFIIDEVHMLSQQAFNAFLKTLEEPPRHAIFILATTEKHKIIPTILSRCQVYDFNRIRVEDSVRYLKYIAQKEGVQFDEESLNLIAQKADGGMRDALSMFDKAVSFCNSNLQYKAVAQTLNVLDYDTYFSMVDLLLEGDYTEALIRFDEVLSKGFSGQTFMAGLNQHLRDLLLAKGPAISLIELTGTLIDRYRYQAEKCPTEFLFGAIALLTEADGRIKQSSNQRLLVELGLMKIASLGKKKNDDIPLADNYPLPDLPTSFTPVATAVGGASAPAPKAAESQRVAPAPVVEKTVERAAEIVAERPAPAPAPTPAPAPAPAPKPTTARRSALAGFSITSLMGAASAASEAAEATNAESARTEQLHYDPLTEQKIVARREEVVEAILHERPRFIVAFEKMAVEGHTVRVEVPTQQLHDEILRSKTEVLLTIARTAGVEGMIDLEVKVNEQIKASRPIKLEDRIKYMTERAPLLLELKKALDMEYE
ncbi:MAG: DNA polymerase III subunit gamma/tau [Rikenellaceae bacterium]|nr:DNA polymerase III subunit gamma/tau [Rikenellaceae bacterium]